MLYSLVHILDHAACTLLQVVFVQEFTSGFLYIDFWYCVVATLNKAHAVPLTFFNGPTINVYLASLPWLSYGHQDLSGHRAIKDMSCGKRPHGKNVKIYHLNLKG